MKPRTHKNKLLVEGNDDLPLCKHLCMHHQVPETFNVIDQNGVENLIDTIDVVLDNSEMTRMGIVVDADTDIAKRWNQLRGKFSQCGYQGLPKSPVPGGLIIPEADLLPRVGVWIMPNNTLPGMLEDFVGYLVPPGDTLWQHAEKSLNEIEPEWRFPAQHFTKARLHTWLAWQEEPGRPIGTAITAKYLDPNAAEAKQLVDWLNQLFNA